MNNLCSDWAYWRENPVPEPVKIGEIFKKFVYFIQRSHFQLHQLFRFTFFLMDMMDLAISPDIPKQSIIIPKWWKWKIRSHYNWQNKNFLYRKIIVWNRFRWIGGNFLNKSMSTGLWLCLERAVKSNVNTQSNTDHFWRTKWNKSLKANKKIKLHSKKNTRSRTIIESS